MTKLCSLLLLLVARITSVFGLPTFTPLGCNADLDSCGEDSIEETTLSSLVDESQSQSLQEEIVIPCGSCVFVDYEDGSIQTLSGGLNIIGSLRFPSNANVTIRTTHVFVQGLLSMEAPIVGNSYGFKLYEEEDMHDDVYIKPHGENANSCDLVSGCKVGRMPFAVVGGRLDINGLRETDCLSHVPLLDLDETRRVLSIGADAAACWWEGPTSANNQIYLTSPDKDMIYGHTTELIDADIANGKVTVSEPLPERFVHATQKVTEYFFSRVASIERSVFLDAEEEEAEGDVDGEYDKLLIGGHLMFFFTPNVEQILEGVKITNFGQQGNLGRYPVHFHLCRDVDGSFISKNVIYNSNQRCAVIHGSHNVTLYDNVALNTFGHCYVTEDGYEIDNLFERNLGANLELPTRKLVTSDGNLESDERGPSVFWIKCPANHWIENVAAGSVHSGFWFETDLKGVRFPSNLIEGSEDFVPTLAIVKTFRDNVVHSNRLFGIQYYSPGWKPQGPESVIEGSIVYRNGFSGHFVHGNGNFVIKDGIVADNLVNIRAFENWGFRIDGLTINGYTENYLDVLDHSNTGWTCKRNPNELVIGIEIHPFNNHGTLQAQAHFSNLIFRGFDDGCPGAVPIRMSQTHLRQKVDFSPRSFVNTSFEGLGQTTTRISTCAANSDGVNSIVVHDKDGTIGPTNLLGAPGFIVANDPKITSFANGDGCLPEENNNLGCLVYCPNACLRMIIVQVSNTYHMEDITMIISDGSLEEEANFARYNLPRNNHNAYSSGTYGAPLPEGSFNLSFVDKVSKKPAWPKYANFLFQKPPECEGYANEASVNFIKPSFDAERCSQLIEDGNIDNLPDHYGQFGQWQTEWIWTMKLDLVTPGYGGSGKAIKASHESGTSCTRRECTLAQWLDSSCFTQWVRYDFSAKVRLVDEEGNVALCENNDTYNCAVAWLDFRYQKDSSLNSEHVIGRITEADPTQDGWYHMVGHFVIDYPFEIPYQAMLKWIYSSDLNIEYVIDEVSLSATAFDPTSHPSVQPSISSAPSASLYPTGVIKNLAFDKPAQQSSTVSTYGAHLAVDGNTDGNYGHGSVTHTGGGANWWMVDLQIIGIIRNIKIYSRTDCCQYRLNGARIDILDYKNRILATRTNAEDNADLIEFTFSPSSRLECTYLRISVLDDILSLAEVEIYGYFFKDLPSSSPTQVPSPRPTALPTVSNKPSKLSSNSPSESQVPSAIPSLSPLPNLALYKPAEQSSTVQGAVASIAVDGNTNGDFYIGESTHTGGGNNWWMVDLQMLASIRDVKIYSRSDCCVWRLNKFTIEVLDNNKDLVYDQHYDNDAPVMIHLIMEGAKGNYVRIKDSIDFLHLAEVEVYGYDLSLTTSPTQYPTTSPTNKNLTDSPTKIPTSTPTLSPTKIPTSTPTLSPTKSPTSSPSPSCTKNKKYMYIEIQTDKNANKDNLNWTVYQKKNNKFKISVLSGSAKKNNQTVVPDTKCISKKKCYKVVLKETPKKKKNKGMNGYLMIKFGAQTKKVTIKKSDWKKQGKKNYLYSVTVNC